jgi:hypothetical protein
MSFDDLDIGTTTMEPFSACRACGGCKMKEGSPVCGWEIYVKTSRNELRYNLCSEFTGSTGPPPSRETLTKYMRLLLALPRRYDDYRLHGVKYPSVGMAMAVLHIQARRLFSVEERVLILKDDGLAPEANPVSELP